MWSKHNLVEATDNYSFILKYFDVSVAWWSPGGKGEIIHVSEQKMPPNFIFKKINVDEIVSGEHIMTIFL